MYKKCCLCKGKGIFEKESCFVCLGERIIDKKTGLPPSKYVTPYTFVPSYPEYPNYPTYPWSPNYPIITYMGENISCGTTIGANNVTATYAKPPFTFTN